MEVKTYRAGSLQEALQLIRQDLGPEAAVLHTREVPRRVLSWRQREVEVTASNEVNVPSRLPARKPAAASSAIADSTATSPHALPAADEADYRTLMRERLQDDSLEISSLVEDLSERDALPDAGEMPHTVFELYSDLIDAEVSEDYARELIDRVQGGSARDLDDPLLLKARVARLIEDEIHCVGPIRVTPGQRKLVALVGPTGVGKTTTIAKLAANFHLRDHHRVGLITVDTYRIAAVDQLRTYADIIDLPMEVVSTPREMRAAVAKLADFDLVLLDTAGRSPRDEVQVQELRSILAEANPDDVQLVLSSCASIAGLKQSADCFAPVGVTSLVFTKLDETTGLGNLLPLLRDCRLPLSYVTNGQNVPDDIQAADRRQLARQILGLDLAR